MDRLSFAPSVRRNAYGWALRAVAAAGFAALLAACEPGVRIIEGPSNCSVVGNSVFIFTGFKVQHNLPRRCPILVTSPVWFRGGQLEWYEAIETVAADGRVPEKTIVYTTIYAPNGGVKRELRNYLNKWTDDLRADISGTYNAASVDPGCTGCQLHDMAYQTVDVPGRGIAVADVYLPYRQAYFADVGGPGSVGYGQNFTLTASVTELARQPVTFEWFVDGQSAGPASQNASTFSAMGYNEGAHQTYQVLVTDVEGGRVWSDPHRVWVSYSEGSGCDPTAIQCP